MLAGRQAGRQTWSTEVEHSPSWNFLTVNADVVARATDRQCISISSTSTSLVSSIPRATIAKLSPTRTMSIPAASATCALGKSCAVSTVIGSPLLYIVRKVFMVTFFLEGSVVLLRGEWELHRWWWWWVYNPDTRGRGVAAKGVCGDRMPRYSN